mgnify:CR=1 FL=1
MRSVLVTGASTGIGRATALRLDAAGWRVFAGVRREEDAEALRAAGSERLVPLTLDVTDADHLAAAAARVEAAGEGLDGLVNNAGVAIPAPLETIPIEDLRRQIEVNLIAQVAVTQALLPELRRARGRIVFIASIGGRIAFPLNGPYHAAKFGIEAVGDVFRQELRPWGLRVSIVEPGSIATPIWERGTTTAEAVQERAGPILGTPIDWSISQSRTPDDLARSRRTAQLDRREAPEPRCGRAPRARRRRRRRRVRRAA